MVTYTDAAITDFASLALSLASAGCPWLQAEAQRLLQAPHSTCRMPHRVSLYVSIYVTCNPYIC